MLNTPIETLSISLSHFMAIPYLSLHLLAAFAQLFVRSYKPLYAKFLDVCTAVYFCKILFSDLSLGRKSRAKAGSGRALRSGIAL